VAKRKQRKRSEISWPIESKRLPFVQEVQRPPPSSSSVPSLCSGSASESRETSSETTDRRSRSSISFVTALKKLNRNSQCSEEGSCSSHGVELESPSKLCTEKEFEEAGNIPIFDAEGNSRPFKSLYTGNQAIGEQQMIIFVRHFFCGVSFFSSLKCCPNCRLIEPLLYRHVRHISKLSPAALA
jgi:hypothetical protein